MNLVLGQQPAIHTGSRAGRMVYEHAKGDTEGPCASSRGGQGPGSRGISTSQKRERIYGGQAMPGVQHLVAEAPSGTGRLRPAGEQGQVGGTDGKGTRVAPVKH